MLGSLRATRRAVVGNRLTVGNSKPKTIAVRNSSSNTSKKVPNTAAQGSVKTAVAAPASSTAGVVKVPLWQRLGPVTQCLEFFARCQRTAPLKTQFASSLTIYTMGDIAAQSINGDVYDPKRTFRALCIGAGSSIPAYKWFMFLGNQFNYRSAALSLATKVVVNQIVFAPCFNTYFFSMQNILLQLQTLPLSSFSFQSTLDHVRRTVPTSLINSCKLWPAVTAFNFTVIAPQYRSIFAGIVAIGWQTYLSFLNRRSEDVEAREGFKVEEVVKKIVPEKRKLSAEEQAKKDSRDMMDA